MTARGLPGADLALARGVASSARMRKRPLVFRGATGARVTTTDGVELTDYVLGMGPMLLGHGRQEILTRVSAQLGNGVLFGTTPLEIELGERLREILPHAERVALVSSGSEATHLAIRIARATTGRRVVLKFEGHYHGWIDPLFVNTQGNAPAPDAEPVLVQHGVAGQPAPDEILVIRWNDLPELEATFATHGSQIAGVILEPLPMNFGAMHPADGYTQRLRELCTSHGALLVFDEVLTGFRVAKGGASEVLGVRPDIAVYAKAIASGFPLAAVVGNDEAMASIVTGPIMPAGTYSGNPVSVAAALATLDVLSDSEAVLYPHLDDLGRRLRDGFRAVAAQHGAPLEVNQIGSVLQLFWGTGAVRTFADASASDRERIARLSESLEQSGALVAPRGLILLSASHTETDVDALIDGLDRSLRTGDT